MSNLWVSHAIKELHADIQRPADTYLIRLPLAAYPGIGFYFKDESTHPRGSLKYRLARSLFLFALCNGWIRETPIVEASSGSTAVSEAYFACLLGLPFIAVMPAITATMLWLKKQLGRRPGTSTGTNVWGMLQIARRMAEEKRKGVIITRLCDSGGRDLGSDYNADWVRENTGDISLWQQMLD